PAHVLGPHVDQAVEAQQGTRGRRRDAVLAGSRLCDHAALAHAPGEQRLSNRVVDLVGAGVCQVLAFQVDASSNPLTQPAREVQGRGPTDEVAKESVELIAERRVLARLRPGGAELVERRDEHLRDVAAAVGAEPLLDGHRAHAGTRASAEPVCARSKNSAMRAWSLRPGSISTPLA